MYIKNEDWVRKRRNWIKAVAAAFVSGAVAGTFIVDAARRVAAWILF